MSINHTAERRLSRCTCFLKQLQQSEWCPKRYRLALGINNHNMKSSSAMIAVNSLIRFHGGKSSGRFVRYLSLFYMNSLCDNSPDQCELLRIPCRALYRFFFQNDAVGAIGARRRFSHSENRILERTTRGPIIHNRTCISLSNLSTVHVYDRALR